MRMPTRRVKLPWFASGPRRLPLTAKEASMRIFPLAHAVLGAAFLVGQPGTVMADFRLSLTGKISGPCWQARSRWKRWSEQHFRLE